MPIVMQNFKPLFNLNEWIINCFLFFFKSAFQKFYEQETKHNFCLFMGKNSAWKPLSVSIKVASILGLQQMIMFIIY